MKNPIKNLFKKNPETIQFEKTKKEAQEQIKQTQDLFKKSLEKLR